MFGLNKNRRNIEVRQTMSRFANRTFASNGLLKSAHDEQRDESRNACILPMLFAPVLETEEELIAHLGPAVSQDVSCEGFSMLSYGQIETDTILAVITDSVEMALLHCEIRHTRHVGYGYYLRGIKVLEKLRWTPFAKLKQEVDQFNQMHEPNLLEKTSC